MGFPSFPPSGRVVSLIDVLSLRGLGVEFCYDSSGTPKREESAYMGGYNRRVSVRDKSKRDLNVCHKFVPTVQNRAEILHSPDLFVRRSFRGTNHLKYFGPETLKHPRMER